MKRQPVIRVNKRSKMRLTADIGTSADMEISLHSKKCFAFFVVINILDTLIPLICMAMKKKSEMLFGLK